MRFSTWWTLLMWVMRMATRIDPLQTSDIARELGVHVNTIRLYEAQGYLPPIPRAENGYRQYSRFHLEQARLVHLTVHWPYLVPYKTLLENLARYSAKHDFEAAMELAYQYLAAIRVERTRAESAVTFLERWGAGYVRETASQEMHTSDAANYLDVTVDQLRNWERNGLIQIPRDPDNGYRLYGLTELSRLRVIRLMIQSGYSLMAILKMLQQFDSGQVDDLRNALEVPPEDRANEAIDVIADRWLSGLLGLEARAKDMIQQISQLIVMSHTA